MTTKIADGVFVITCVILSGVAVAGYLSRSSRPPAHEGVIGGDQLYPLAASPNHKYTVVAYIHPKCRYCTESLRLYRRLQSLASPAGAELRFQSTVSTDELRRYLEESGFPRPTIAAGPMPSGVKGTPTIVTYDSRGRPLASWEGRLTASQEKDVERYFGVDADR